MEHDTDQLDSNRQQTQCRPRDSQGVGGSEIKTPDVQGDDNPSPTPQNFFNQSAYEPRSNPYEYRVYEAGGCVLRDLYRVGEGWYRLDGLWRGYRCMRELEPEELYDE